MIIESLFPVQKQVIPIILSRNNEQSIYPNDLCVLAPTGSGKTLTYVLPIIEKLRNRIKPCCRAIVLLPVSDLAEQVFEVFKTNISQNTVSFINENASTEESNSLRVILLSNKHPFAKEQLQLVNENGKCLNDIIVATPGRLVDHILKTKGFDLTDLRYLVLDECDRIMEQIKQNWLPILNQAVFSHFQEFNSDFKRDTVNSQCLNVHNLVFDKKNLLPYQKLLFSATLTKNPEKLEQIKLFQPVYFTVGAEKLKNLERSVEEKTVNSEPAPQDGDIEMGEAKKTENQAKTEKKSVKEITSMDVDVPKELNEIFIQVLLPQKPLVAIYLIKTLGYRRMLCFVKSIETVKRLNKLFELNGIKSMEYSSTLHAARRKRVQAKFESDKLDVLVCSDVMARGMDLANVDYVLLYDSPSHLSSYIHKVGRTARAGKTGTAITLLQHKEVYFFKKMISPIGPGSQEGSNQKNHKIKEVKVQKSQLKNLMDDYKNSLLKLKEIINKT